MRTACRFALGLLLLWGTPGPSFAAAPVIFRRGNDAEPDTIDPARADTLWANAVTGDMFLGLTTEDPDAKPIPGAAERWDVSPDGLVWTFHLRPDLVWSDGAPLKASDYVFGMRRMLDPKTASVYAFIQFAIKNAEAANSGKVPLDQVGIRALDDRTVEITLASPTPYLPGLLSHNTAFPIPEHAYRKYGEAGWMKPGNIVTNGPFVLTEWTPHDHITLAKNPRFYDAANVKLDQVIFYPLENDSQSLARYRAGELDASIGRGAFPIDDLAFLRDILPGQVHVASQLANDYLIGNMRRPPFNDLRLRRAISLCIDRPLLAAKVYKDGSVPAAFFVPPGIADYHGGPHLDFADLPMDKRREEARRLLADAGYGPKHPLEFDFRSMPTTGGRRTAVTISAMLQECNMTAHIQFFEPKIYYSQLQTFDFTFAWAAWVADFNDPYTFLHLLDSRAGPYNYQGYNNPAYDKLLDQAQATLDLDQRAALLAKAEQMALDDSAIIPLTFTAFRMLVQTYVRGYVDNPIHINRSRWISFDKH